MVKGEAVLKSNFSLIFFCQLVLGEVKWYQSGSDVKRRRER